MINSVLQALRRGIGQAAPGFPDADFGLSLRLAVSALAKVRLEKMKIPQIVHAILAMYSFARSLKFSLQQQMTHDAPSQR